MRRPWTWQGVHADGSEAMAGGGDVGHGGGDETFDVAARENVDMMAAGSTFDMTHVRTLDMVVVGGAMLDMSEVSALTWTWKARDSWTWDG